MLKVFTVLSLLALASLATVVANLQPSFPWYAYWAVNLDNGELFTYGYTTTPSFAVAAPPHAKLVLVAEYRYSNTHYLGFRETSPLNGSVNIKLQPVESYPKKAFVIEASYYNGSPAENACYTISTQLAIVASGTLKGPTIVHVPRIPLMIWVYKQNALGYCIAMPDDTKAKVILGVFQPRVEALLPFTAKGAGEAAALIKPAAPPPFPPIYTMTTKGGELHEYGRFLPLLADLFHASVALGSAAIAAVVAWLVVKRKIS
ncbi:MAG: hypothetical protein J7L98_02915 [Candidatus Verstraetearchaeota archaeon]|nr:hypothetical protein [Candidatus Verstraetearchaeota archaeon]